MHLTGKSENAKNENDQNALPRKRPFVKSIMPKNYRKVCMGILGNGELLIGKSLRASHNKNIFFVTTKYLWLYSRHLPHDMFTLLLLKCFLCLPINRTGKHGRRCDTFTQSSDNKFGCYRKITCQFLGRQLATIIN